MEDLVAAWWRFQELQSGTRIERKALSDGEPADVCLGWDRARDLIDAGGPGAVEFVRRLITAAPDDAGIGLVGAGPMEDLLYAHGPELAPTVEALARRELSIARALASVWGSGLAAEVLERLG